MVYAFTRAATGAAFLVAGAIAMSGPASAAGYLKIGDIKGESTEAADEGHKDWINLLSYSFGAGDTASGQPTGKRQHKPLTVTKSIDKASPAASSGAGGAGKVKYERQSLRNTAENSQVLNVTLAPQSSGPLMAACRSGKTIERLSLSLPDENGNEQPMTLHDVTVSGCGEPQARAGIEPDEIDNKYAGSGPQEKGGLDRDIIRRVKIDKSEPQESAGVEPDEIDNKYAGGAARRAQPSESFSLNFSKIVWTAAESRDGKKKGNVEYEWKVEEGE